TRISTLSLHDALPICLIDDSGVLRRELFQGRGERALTNYQHIFELLLEESVRSRGTLRDLVTTLGGYMAGTRIPTGEDPSVQRRSAEHTSELQSRVDL